MLWITMLIPIILISILLISILISILMIQIILILILNRSIYQILKILIFSIFDENVARFKVDRNNMLMSSYFACTHVFDPNFVNLLSKIHENSKKHRFYHFFDRSKKLIDRSIDDTQKLMCDAHCNLFPFAFLFEPTAMRATHIKRALIKDRR